jgi:ATP synthase I chain
VIPEEQELFIREVCDKIIIFTMTMGFVGLGITGFFYGFLFGARFMVGIWAGGILIYFNLRWFASIVRKILTQTGSPAIFALSLVFKVLTVYAVVALLIALKLVMPIPFLIGLGSLVLSLLYVGIRQVNDKSPDESGS